MAIERIKPAFHFEAERLEQLKQIAPEAFADGKINWETLQEALGDYLEEEDITAEHFGLFWPGKKAARKIASIPSEGTLIPCPGEGIDEENTQNIFIEGENLEVLKLLQKSYPSKIKMIYIDPPYNTGNDFIYEDNFTETIDEYLKRTGQLDEEAKPVSANTKSDGRFHSKWLSMMYPRLRAARNLMREDGVIFISIDDNEVANLKLLMNEVFGEENFQGQFVINSTPNARDYGHIGKMHEYCLFYSKNPLDAETNLLEDKEKNFKYSDEIGDFNVHPLYNSNVAFTNLNRPNLYYPFYLNLDNNISDNFYEISLSQFKNSKKIFPPKSVKDNVQFVWRWGKEKSQGELNKNIIGYLTEDGEYRIVQKMRTTEKIIRSLLLEKEFTSRRGTADLENLLGKKIFSFPKPVELIKTLIKVGSSEGDIILDFFAGSGTLAQAIYELNKESQVNRNFIIVQIPEPINDNANAIDEGYVVITDVTKERLSKASKKFGDKKNKIDTGFKIFKLQHSNFKIWKHYIGSDIKELEFQFEKNTTPLVDDWKSESLVAEILLIEGFPLNSKLEVLDQYKKNEVTMVTSDFCEHKLLVCLDKKVYADTIKSLQLNEDDVFICLDSAITDQDKVTLQDKGLIKTI